MVESTLTVQACAVDLPGCGFFVDDDNLDRCCTCKSVFNENSLISTAVHCYLYLIFNPGPDQPTCCPCFNLTMQRLSDDSSSSSSSSSFSSNSSSSSSDSSSEENGSIFDIETCAERRDLRRLKKLVRRQERLARKTIARCGGLMTDGCVKPWVQSRLNYLSDEIHEIIQYINESCGLA